MFGKKLLSIIGLLFAGQIAYVSADCEPAYDSGLKLNEDGDCTVGYYLLNKAGTAALASGADTECSGDTCKLVYCSDTTGSTACVPQTVTGLVTYALDGETILECTDGDCKITEPTESQCSVALAGGIITGGSKLCITAVDDSEVVFDYDVTGDSYYYIEVAVDSTTVFTGPTAVQDDPKKVLVKIGKGIAQLVESFGDTTTSYLAHDGNSEIAVKYGGSTIDKNTGLTGGTPIYCVNGETSAIEDRKANFCGSNVACSQYCTFSDGVCTKITTDAQFVFERSATCNPIGTSEEKAACNPGYFIKYNGALITASTTVATIEEDASKLSLIECTGTDCTPIDSGSFPIGYIANSDPLSNGSTSGNVPFIKCTANNSCSTIEAADNKSSCDASGVLVNSDSFCLKTEGTITAALDAPGKYLLNTSDTSIFNTNTSADHYVIVEIKYGSVLMVRKDDIVAEGGEFRYVYTDDTLEIFGRKNTNICSSNKTIKEFMLDKQDDIIKTYTDNEYYASNGEDTTWP